MVATPRLGTSAIPASHVLGSKLDSIPSSPYHLLIILVLGLVGLVEGYDLAMTGSLLVLAKEPLHTTPGEIRVLAVASNVMICVGGFTASAISDHWSRRTIMLIGVATTNFFTLLMADRLPPGWPVGLVIAHSGDLDHPGNVGSSSRRRPCRSATCA
jgi:hypothetical protein